MITPMIVPTTTTHPAIGTTALIYGTVKVPLIIPKPTAKETIIPTIQVMIPNRLVLDFAI